MDDKARVAELTAELRQLHERAARAGWGSTPLADAAWQASVSAAPEIIVLMDRDYKVLYVNHPPPGIGEYLGTSALDWTAEADRPTLRAAVERLLDSGLPQHYEVVGAGAGGKPTRYSSWIYALCPSMPGGAIAIVTTDVTHTSQVEGELRDTQGMLESLVASAPDHIVVVDREHTILFSNRDSIAGLFDTAAGARIEAHLPPLEAGAVREAIDAVLVSRAAASHEVRLAREGAHAWYSLRLNPVLRAGEVERIVIILTDISDRKINEWALYHERAFLSALDRINRVIVSADSVHGMLRDFVAEVCALFSCDRAWVAHPVDPAADLLLVPYQGIRQGSDEVEPLSYEIPITEQLRATLIRDLATRGVRRRDPELDPIDPAETIFGCAGVRSQLTMTIRPQIGGPWIVGIHDQHRSRVYDDASALFEAIGNRLADGLTGMLSVQNLRESEAQLRTLVEHAPECIAIVDVDSGRLVDVNNNAVRLFGHSRRVLLSRGLRELSPSQQPDGRDSEAVLDEMTRAALRGERPIFEWEHLRADGRAVPCELRLVVLPAEERRLLRASITDITDRRAAEAERQRLAEQLQQAQKMEAIGQLTGGVAHDFNNLLTVILGHLELIEFAPDGEHNVMENVEPALEACRRASALTQRLLAFSRKQALRPESVDLRELVTGMERLLRRTLGETIEVETVTGAGLWRCDVDPSQLGSAILNLAINARDAMPAGGRLTIEAANVRLDSDYAEEHQDVAPGQYVMLAVTDDGVGMTEEIAARVFEPFFTTKGVGRGSGLGLSMIYGFVKQTGGHVKIYSEVGEGTTVKLYLPRALIDTPAGAPGPAVPREPRGHGELVLIVEDDEHVRRLTTALLARLGYDTLEAGDGASALAILRARADTVLLFTDVVLPGGMNGVVLAKEALALRPGLRVLYTSGYTENAIIHHGRLDPGVDLLEKPFSKEGLARRVRSVLDRPGPDSGADSQ